MRPRGGPRNPESVVVQRVLWIRADVISKRVERSPGWVRKLAREEVVPSLRGTRGCVYVRSRDVEQVIKSMSILKKGGTV